ncbi:MAG: transglutaminase domain-containing protein [Acidobacteria bacterium]|nr:transglutaminase domain-containing protein [Acidobacteriota bacterium]
MTDAYGRFTLPHLTWYPYAEYNLIVRADNYHLKHLKIIAPPSYPPTGIIEAGELDFEAGEAVDEPDKPAHYLRVEGENDDYYRKLFAAVTAHAGTDHEKIQAINKYVASRHNPKENAWSFHSARQILERGAPHCSNLAFAMAILCAAGGYPSRTIHTSDDLQYSNTHVVTEVYYGEAWHLYDPTYGVFFRDEKGIVMGYKELHLKPNFITPDAFPEVEPAVIEGILSWMPQAYRSGLHQSYQVKKDALCVVW